MKPVSKKRLWSKIRISILFVFIIMPEILTQIRLVAYVFAGVQLLIFGYFGLRVIKKHKGTKEYLYWSGIAFYLLIVMLLNGNYGDIDKWGRLLILVLDTMMVLDYYVEKRQIRDALDALTFLGILYFAINSIMIIQTPQGFLISNGLPYFFLGLRTDFLKFFFPFVLIGGLNYIYFKRLWPIVVLSIFSIYNFLELDVSTSIISVIVLGLMLVFRKQFIRFLDVKRAIIVATALNIGFLFLNAASQFGWLIVDVLKKDFTLTNRMYIWNIAIQKILESRTGLIFGHGIVNGGAFVRFGLYGSGIYWPAHNQLLQWIFEYGLIGTCAIFAFLISLDRTHDKKPDSYYCHAVFLAMMITGISSDPFGNHIGYVCVCFLPLIDKIRTLVGYQNSNMKRNKNSHIISKVVDK